MSSAIAPILDLACGTDSISDHGGQGATPTPGSPKAPKRGALLPALAAGDDGRPHDLALVTEVFRHYPLDLAVAFDDNWQAGSLVLNHRLVDAPLESLQNQTAVFEHDAMDALVQLRSRVQTTALSIGTTVTFFASSADR